MLSDKMTVVTNPATRMDRACVLVPAGRDAKEMRQGVAVHREVWGPNGMGVRRVRSCGFRLALTRSVLAAAMASLAPLYGATAQEAATDTPTTSDPQAETDAATSRLDTVEVTGTRIKGGSVPSPVITITSERIREEGFTDLGEVIRSLPQNFTGGQNPGVLMGNVAGGGLANQNVTGGSGLNLRGLGPDASLTLLNGRRMSYGGFVQAVDISAIPVEAVERIEIVADGASAIYGSDAVGGVGNVILKRDFEGVAVGTRHGAAADGGLTTHEYSATAGAAWPGGGLIATYKDVSTDPIFARQREYTSHLLEPSTIYAGSQLRSGLVSAHQWLGERVELRVDALRTRRDQSYFYYLSVPTRYNAMAPETTTSFVSPGIDVMLPNDWTLSVSGAWGRDELISDHSRVAVATGVVSPYLYECFCNKSRTYEASAEGSLPGLLGRDARLAVGAGYKKNDFTWANYLAGTVSAQGRESSRFAYAEFSMPLVGASSGAAGAALLEATAAVRSEDYDSFGSVTTPKLGLIYRPGPDYTLKASWGKSFKTPTLFQRQYGVIASLVYPRAYGGVGYASDETVLAVFGGNTALEPERARTWSASVAFHPQALPGLEVEATWFDIDYTDRVVQPINNYADALRNPIYAEFIDFAPSAARQEELLAAAGSLSNSTGGAYAPDKVVAILDARFVNANRQRIRGLDVSGSYRFDIGNGLLTLRGAASWLDSAQKTAGTLDFHDLSGTLHNPARLSGRVGGVFTHAGFTASAFANHTGGVTNTSDGKKGASFTTFDATLAYRTGQGGGALSGLAFALSAQNLLDRSPPLYAPVAANYVAPFDSTSYSAIGRFVSLSVSKHW